MGEAGLPEYMYIDYDDDDDDDDDNDDDDNDDNDNDDYDDVAFPSSLIGQVGLPKHM
jgi:hypothetical protein